MVVEGPVVGATTLLLFKLIDARLLVRQQSIRITTTSDQELRQLV
jgi:hypothetical protein